MTAKTLPSGQLNFIQQWIVPRSTDPEESFRERTIRIALPIVALFRLPFVFIILGGTHQSFFDTGFIPAPVVVLLLLVPLVIAYWAIRTQRIVLSGVSLLFTWVFTDLCGAWFTGY